MFGDRVFIDGLRVVFENHCDLVVLMTIDVKMSKKVLQRKRENTDGISELG